MARYGFQLASGRTRLDIKFNDTIGFSQNATGISLYNVAPVARAAAIAAAPAGGTGTAAGGYDTAANRDVAIATINSIRTALTNIGLTS